MKQRHSTAFVRAIPAGILFFILLPVSYLIFFHKNFLLQALPANFIFLILCVFFIISPYGNIRLHGNNETLLPCYSLKKWLGFIVLIELLAGLFFISLLKTGIFYEAAVSPADTIVPPDVAMMLGNLFLNWGLFPWSLYALLACMLGFAYFCENQPGLFSTFLPPVRSMYYDRMTRRGINIFTTTITNIAFTVMLVIIFLQISLFFLMRFHLYSPYNLKMGAAVCYLFVAMLLLSPALEYYIHHVGRRAKRIWIYLLPFAGLNVLMIILCTVAGSFLAPYITESLARVDFAGLLAKRPALGNWPLLTWSWWVVAAPLTASLIARLSSGRTLREVLLGVLLLPMLIAYGLLIALTYPHSILGTGLLTVGQLLQYLGNNHYLSLIAPLMMLSFFMTLKDSRYSTFGFMPYKKNYVTARVIKPQQFIPPLFQFTLLFIMGFLFMNLSSIQYLTTLAAIPTVLFFMVCCLQFFRRLYGMHLC